MKIYFAGPLFSEAERDYNLKIASKLREQGWEVWLPQENQPEKFNASFIYDMDIEHLEKADVVVANLDGVDVDSGTAFEIGYATAKGKKVFGLKTDQRAFSNLEEINLMIEVPAIIRRDIDSLITVVKESVHQRKKSNHTKI
ncbi:MAG: DUF4406 domain-containing protein [Nitrososphaeria archaeon]|nr:DUF4406 domain-containing protein [Nitrososphaeria archaeon]NIQ33691.1 DUF4406 domain-containing protein [Nitrososphaeria archaeon]